MFGKVSSGARLVLEDGSVVEGEAFGAKRSVAGEVVFTTGMVGYPESMTDPSYEGQILVLTYPLVGNYGVPASKVVVGLEQTFESDRIHIAGLIVQDLSKDYSHWDARRSLDAWMRSWKIPGITGVDTRALTKRLRSKGTMLGKLLQGEEQVDWRDPAKEGLLEEVSVRKPVIYGRGRRRVMLLDCGVKLGIVRSLLERDCKVIRVPYDYDVSEHDYDGLVISNGPGDPARAEKTIAIVRKAMRKGKPVFGICLGNQLLAMAAGARTYKLRYGHRSQNQPCVEVGTKRCFITSQNHGYAVDGTSLPAGWREWFINANDGSNEGIRHASKPFFSVQFHPEAKPGPTDTEFLFDRFVKVMRR